MDDKDKISIIDLGTTEVDGKAIHITATPQGLKDLGYKATSAKTDDRIVGVDMSQDPPTVIKAFSHGDLLKTLYFVFDTFTPFNIQFFPVRETGRAILAEKQLSGNQIDIGIRRNEWHDNSKFYIYHNFENEHVEKLNADLDSETWEKDGVKIVFHFYDDNPCIEYLATIPYEYENWLMPQRFEEFCEKYDK